MNEAAETELRRGFTTGSAAAAAAVAAARFLSGGSCSAVTLNLPGGREIVIPVTGCRRTSEGAEGWVTKDAGDDPDVTHGAVIAAEVVITEERGITILGGTGVGVVTKPGLLVPPGLAAINPGPMALIRKSLGEELPQGMGAAVTISVPGGEELARRTYNPKIGILGGLSILGTTGIVNPMSADAIMGTIKSELSVLRASGAQAVCLVPGNYGRRMAALLGVPDGMIVNIGNFAGESLATAGSLGFAKLILIGQIGKFAKLAAGSLDTHSSKSDGRLEAIAAYSALHGATSGDVSNILSGSIADEIAVRITKTEWGMAALEEVTSRIAKVALAGARGVSECACLAFSLPDRELTRTNNFDRLIGEIKAGPAELL